MASSPFTKRASILGLPIGFTTIAWGRIAALVAGVLGVGGAAALAYKGEQKVEEITDHAPIEEGEHAIQEISGTVDKVSGVIDKVSDVASAVSGASGIFGKLKAGLQALGGGGGGGAGKKLRLLIAHHQDVAVPRTVAYNQWTQLEDFPEFMKGVQSVELTGEDAEEGDITESDWTVKIGITTRQFKAEVTEAVPDERIAWKSVGGAQHSGVVTFHSLDDNLTKVQLEMEYIPSGIVEKIGNIFLAARRKALKDLRLYKHYMELQGEETGSWRGEISQDDEDAGSADDAAAEAA